MFQSLYTYHILRPNQYHQITYTMLFNETGIRIGNDDRKQGAVGTTILSAYEYYFLVRLR